MCCWSIHCSPRSLTALCPLEVAIDLAGRDTKVIPGHGLAVVWRDAMVEFLDMTVDVRDTVRMLISEGKTLDEVMALRPTTDYHARPATDCGG